VPRLDPAYPLRTERLELRPFTADDVGALHAILSREDVARWVYHEPSDEDEVGQTVAKRMGHTSISEPGDRLDLAVVLASTGELIGNCLLILRSADHSRGEIGYTLHPDHQGHGYATEASQEMLRLGFEELGLHRIEGRLEPRNGASAAVLERLGMRHEGCMVENEWVKGEWQSEDVYAILDREWRAATR
jgi:RimJ/RimL family protein N-acetyltransferase